MTISTHRHLLCGALFALAVVASPLMASAQSTNGSTQGPTTPSVTTFTKAQYKHATLLLSSHHALPSKAQFEKVSPSVQTLLHNIAQNQTTFALHRVRALEALGQHWQNQKAFALYGTMLNDAKTPEGTKHRLLMMSTKFYGVKGLVHVKPFVDHKDLQLRWTAATAVMALTKTNSDARAILSPRLTKEKQVHLLNKIRIFLGEIK